MRSSNVDCETVMGVGGQVAEEHTLTARVTDFPAPPPDTTASLSPTSREGLPASLFTGNQPRTAL